MPFDKLMFLISSVHTNELKTEKLYFQQIQRKFFFFNLREKSWVLGVQGPRRGAKSLCSSHPGSTTADPPSGVFWAALHSFIVCWSPRRQVSFNQRLKKVWGLGVSSDWKENFPFSLGQQYWSFFECCNQLCAKWGPISPYTAPGIQRKKCFQFSSERLISHTADQIKTVWANCASSYPHLLWNPPGRNRKVGLQPALAFCRGRKLAFPSFHGLSETKREPTPQIFHGEGSLWRSGQDLRW